MCGRAMLRHEWAGSTGDGNAFVSPLVFRVSMGGGDCLPSGDPSAQIPAYTIKKNRLPKSKNSKLKTKKILSLYCLWPTANLEVGATIAPND
uniref:SFRICE_034605 n=1 Tax=Spodoptera frugiperda TaxID=7108 RepID=A0A2H1VR30_SPOFR